MSKHINVEPETHLEVDKIRAINGHVTFDKAVQALLRRPDLTEAEIHLIAKVMETLDPEKVDEEFYNRGHDIIKKCSEHLHESALAECLDDRCKAGRKAGAKLQEDLLNGDITIPGIVGANCRCIEKVNAIKKAD